MTPTSDEKGLVEDKVSAPIFRVMGDSAILVEIGTEISPSINRRVHDICAHIVAENLPGIVELVPTYSSFVIHFDPMAVSYDGLKKCVLRIETMDFLEVNESKRIVVLPTLYGDSYGPDLESVAQETGYSVEEVIAIHSEKEYLVYGLGFSPGFPYLGDLPSGLACPRLPSPRLEVPAGSVAIAESQTGVYPVASPGGWRLIGKTPLKLFDEYRESPALVEPGDYLKFDPLASIDDYKGIEKLVNDNEYEIEVIGK